MITFSPSLDDLCNTYDIDTACGIVNDGNDFNSITFNLICKVDQGNFYRDENNNQQAEVVYNCKPIQSSDQIMYSKDPNLLYKLLQLYYIYWSRSMCVFSLKNYFYFSSKNIQKNPKKDFFEYFCL